MLTVAAAVPPHIGAHRQRVDVARRLLPQARPAGVRPRARPPAVVCTGRIGLLAMMARLPYLREHSAQR